MQWQLDKRTHDVSAGTNSERPSSTRHKSARKRLVFHERSAKHANQQQQRRHMHTVNTGAAAGSSSNSSMDVAAGSSSSDDAAAAAAAGSSVTDLEQQQQQGDDQFYCFHLDHAAQDLHKAQDRLAKHILQVRPLLAQLVLQQLLLLVALYCFQYAGTACHNLHSRHTWQPVASQ